LNYEIIILGSNNWNVLDQFILEIPKVYISFVPYHKVRKFVREMIHSERQEVSRMNVSLIESGERP